MPGLDSKRARPTRPVPETPNQRVHSNGADRVTMPKTLSQDNSYQETSGAKRRRSPGGFQSDSKRSCPDSFSHIRNASHLDARCDEEPRRTMRAPEAKMTTSCDGPGCSGYHSLGQCPPSNKCRDCQSTHHTLADCPEICKGCGHSRHPARLCSDPRSAATRSQFRDSLPHQDFEDPAYTPILAFENPSNDNTIDVQGQRRNLVRSMSPDTQARTLAFCQQQMEQEEWAHLLEMDKIREQGAYWRLRQGHIREEQKVFDEYNSKRKETIRKREESEGQYRAQLEAIDRQREEDKRQHTRQLRAMRERHDHELAEYRQRRTRKHQSLPA